MEFQDLTTEPKWAEGGGRREPVGETRRAKPIVNLRERSQSRSARRNPLGDAVTGRSVVVDEAKKPTNEANQGENGEIRNIFIINNLSQ